MNKQATLKKLIRSYNSFGWKFLTGIDIEKTIQMTKYWYKHAQLDLNFEVKIFRLIIYKRLCMFMSKSYYLDNFQLLIRKVIRVLLIKIFELIKIYKTLGNDFTYFTIIFGILLSGLL